MYTAKFYTVEKGEEVFGVINELTGAWAEIGFATKLDAEKCAEHMNLDDE